MKQITEISQDPKQRFDVTTEDNQTFELKLEYSDQQQGWFYSKDWLSSVMMSNFCFGSSDISVILFIV